MRKAIPHPPAVAPAKTITPWAAEIDRFDRRMRWSNLKWKTHVIRMDTTMVGIIATDRTFPKGVMQNIDPLDLDASES